MATTNHGERLGGVEKCGAGNESHRFFPGVDQIRVLLPRYRIRAHSQQSVFGVNEDIHPWRNVIGNQCGHADAEIDIKTVSEFLCYPAYDYFSVVHQGLTVRLSIRFSYFSPWKILCTKIPGVWIKFESNSP